MNKQSGFLGQLLIVCLFLVSLTPSFAQQAVQQLPGKYQFFVDLTQVKDDKLTVTLIAPKITPKDGNDEIIYFMPKIVPGTYSIYDFGRFLSEFNAYDAAGNKLNVARLDDNRFKIVGASKLHKITYRVEDTYDTSQDNFIFEPCGTNIEENKNFVINTHGFFGYFDGMKRTPYEVSFTKPDGFFGSTSLKAVASDKKTDRFESGNYMDLVDAPIMYCRPDTTVINVGGAEILISVYSPLKSVDSKYVADNIRSILTAQKDYLGGKLPIDRYAFIIYMFTQSGSGALGALEHSYSSLYFLPEDNNKEYITQTIRDVAAHEFFHIITPLSIHSEQIGDFDYIKPEMSKHLWLYEGVTEYFAGHVQAKYGLMNLDQYIEVLRNKMVNADGYTQNKKVSFTEMSKKCLDTYKDQYGNVYEKGALIGLCLDIRLRQLSGGKYGLQQLMADLSKVYGKDKSFKDDELFDQIAKMTYPEIRRFFADYVEGSKPLPLEEMLGAVGIHYKSAEVKQVVSIGNIMLAPDQEENAILIVDNSQMDPLGVAMGYHTGDRIIQINDKKVTSENFTTVLNDVLENGKAGDKFKVVVMREEKGKMKKKTLKSKLITREKTAYHSIGVQSGATEEQMKLRQAWLK